jgi:hypothetical protein
MLNVLKRVSPVLAAILFFSASLLAQDQNTTTQSEVVQEENPLVKSSAAELVDNLAIKVTLSDEQKKGISDAVYKYQASFVEVGENSGSTSESTDNTETEQQRTKEMGEESGTVSGNNAYTEEWLNTEIESILDDTQKSQWETVKADFWNQLRDKVASFQQKEMY